jgi:large subunit ribosomal protein L32
MPNPKRRHSKTRQRKRRTHDKAELPTLSVDQTTGVTHLRHRAHFHEGDLYYKGKKILSKGE